MTRPGVSILGDVGEDRDHGMGIVVEYAGATGKPVGRSAGLQVGLHAVRPPRARRHHLSTRRSRSTFTKDNAALDGFNQWRINGVAFSMDKKQPNIHVRHGARYRLLMHNGTDDIHTHSSATGRASRSSASPAVLRRRRQGRGMLDWLPVVEIDFTANATGLSLFHCHQQVHMDFGFMALFDCR